MRTNPVHVLAVRASVALLVTTIGVHPAPAVAQQNPVVRVRTHCGADPQAMSIKLRRLGTIGATANMAQVVGSVENLGTAPQSSRVAGHQTLALYAIGVAGYRPSYPIAQIAVPPLAVNGTAFVSKTMRFPFTLGDVPTQFRLVFSGDPDIQVGSPQFDCDTTNDVVTLTVDTAPFYPGAAH